MLRCLQRAAAASTKEDKVASTTVQALPPMAAAAVPETATKVRSNAEETSWGKKLAVMLTGENLDNALV